MGLGVREEGWNHLSCPSSGSSDRRVGRGSPPYTGGREPRSPPHAQWVALASSRSRPNPLGEGRRLGAFAASTGGPVSDDTPACCTSKNKGRKKAFEAYFAGSPSP